MGILSGSDEMTDRRVVGWVALGLVYGGWSCYESLRKLFGDVGDETFVRGRDGACGRSLGVYRYVLSARYGVSACLYVLASVRTNKDKNCSMPYFFTRAANLTKLWNCHAYRTEDCESMLLNFLDLHIAFAKPS